MYKNIKIQTTKYTVNNTTVYFVKNLQVSNNLNAHVYT